MSALQDQDQRTHICVDFQPQNEGEARQVGAGRSGSAAQCVRGSLGVWGLDQSLGIWGQGSVVERDFILLGMAGVYHVLSCLKRGILSLFVIHIVQLIKFYIYCNIYIYWRMEELK